MMVRREGSNGRAGVSGIHKEVKADRCVASDNSGSVEVEEARIITWPNSCHGRQQEDWRAQGHRIQQDSLGYDLH